MLPPRLLYYQPFTTDVAINTGVINVGLVVEAASFGCDPNDVVWVVVQSQDCVVDWGIPPYSRYPVVQSADNGLRWSPIGTNNSTYTNATSGFQRPRYCRTGVAGSCEVFAIQAGLVRNIIAYIVNTSNYAWDPELGLRTGQNAPQKTASIAVYDRYPNDANWVRTVDWCSDQDGNGYQEALSTDADTVMAAPPLFARFVHVACPGEFSGGIPPQFMPNWQIVNTVTGQVLSASQRANWASPIAPWCHVRADIPPGGGETFNAVLSWSVRPMFLHFPDGPLATAITGQPIEVTEVP